MWTFLENPVNWLIIVSCTVSLARLWHAAKVKALEAEVKKLKGEVHRLSVTSKQHDTDIQTLKRA